MRKALVVARHEYRTNVRTPRYLVVTALPLLGIGLLGVLVALGGGVIRQLDDQAKAQTIGVVDASGIFQPLLAPYQGTHRLYPDEPAGRAALRAGTIDGLVIVPVDYLDRGVTRLVVRERTWAAAALQTSDAWRAFFVDHLVGGRLEEPLRERLGDPVRGQEVVSLAAREEGRPGSGAVAAVAFLMASAFGASAYVMRGIADEKDSRIMEILLSSITPLELLGGKIVGLALVGLTQVAVRATSWAVLARFGSARAASALGVPGARIAILWLAFYVLGFLLYSVLTGVIGSLGKSAGGESQVLAALILAPAVLPLPVLWVDASSSLARILSLVPLTAPSAMMLRLDAVPVPWTEVALSVVGLAVTIPAALWGGVKLFRVGLGLSGNRPGWRVLARAR